MKSSSNLSSLMLAILFGFSLLSQPAEGRLDEMIGEEGEGGSAPTIQTLEGKVLDRKLTIGNNVIEGESTEGSAIQNYNFPPGENVTIKMEAKFWGRVNKSYNLDTYTFDCRIEFTITLANGSVVTPKPLTVKPLMVAWDDEGEVNATLDLQDNYPFPIAKIEGIAVIKGHGGQELDKWRIIITPAPNNNP